MYKMTEFSKIAALIIFLSLKCSIFVVNSTRPSYFKCPSPLSTFPASPAVIQEHRQYSEQLYKRIKLWQLGVISSPRKNRVNGSSVNFPQSRSFEILEQVLEITKSVCPKNFVSHDALLEGAMNAFYFLRNDNIMGETHVYNVDPINRQLYNRINKILLSCLETLREEGVGFVGAKEEGDCSNGLIRKICQGGEDPDSICTGLKLRQRGNGCPSDRSRTSTNLIFDIVWKMVDLVHGACVPDFRRADDLIAFHAWEQAMEQLFSRRMRRYWYQPGMSIEDYQSILHPNLVMQMHNLEMCVEGLYFIRGGLRTPRLQRPPYSFSIFRKRKRRDM